jgi:hypothetical protein
MENPVAADFLVISSPNSFWWWRGASSVVEGVMRLNV